MSRKGFVALAASACLVVGTPLAVVAAPAAASPAATSMGQQSGAPLTNLAHLDFLRASVTPVPAAGHTTYELDTRPEVGVLWTYAEPTAPGSSTYKRIGGGTYDPVTDTYGQGAYNTDDISRAAVVYLRHWQQTGAASSQAAAFELLRGLTYFQTTTGPDAGNVVLWMQPDGTLNPSADPVELPDPSDSEASYWLARTVWALGEGYAAFQDADPAFAAFLQERMELSIDALERQVLDAYGTFQVVDGVEVPAWLVVDGADASAEAVLGLAAYVEHGGGAAAQTALQQLAEGVAALSAGDARTWPFGAVLPWGLSRSVWHAWGSQMPAALAEASEALDDPALLEPAVRDSATFLPWLLTSGGPDNGRLPVAVERAQIAYGADSRVQSLMATAEASGRKSFRDLAGLSAAWFFGANASGAPAYDPATGRTVDGIEADGRVNPNAGAESTIHGLLSMLVLDANPDVAELARLASIRERVGTTVVEAEAATLAGGAAIVTPADGWTGESRFSGGSYVTAPDDSSLSFAIASSDQRRLVLPVVDLQPDSDAVSRWSSDRRRLGAIDSGDVGAQGVSPAPGALLPVTLPRWLPADADSLDADVVAGEDAARIDAVMLEPRVSRYVVSDAGSTVALLRSAAGRAVRAEVEVPGRGRAVVEVFDADGQRQSRRTVVGTTVRAQVLPGGFTLVQR